MASATLGKILHPQPNSNIHFFSAQPIRSLAFPTLYGNHEQSSKSGLLFSSHQSNLTVAVKSSPGKTNVVSTDDGEGVSLGTMKLPLDTDIPRFEILLFQWANSLCQGAQLPLPVPLKVDKIEGGVRLGFVTMEEYGKTEVKVYIDCIVIPGSNDSANPPIFIATRNGALKDKVPPGEPRIMKSLLAALRKSAEIARV